MRDRSPHAVWETALGQLELQVTRPNFETWLRNTTGLQLEGNDLIVGAPTDFAVEWLRSRLSSVINRTVSQLLGDPVSVSFQVLGAPALPVPDHRPAQPAPSRPPVELDSRLTFDTFTVVKSNRLAYRAARRLVDGEGSGSPLVLFGPTGLGKSHLLHAIGHIASGGGKRVALLTGEAFVTRYGDTVRAGHPHTFRQMFADLDILLLDDLGFLTSRAASQEQFLHVFNTLHAAGRIVAVTASQGPSALTGLSPSLRSRLQAGLTAELHPLSKDDRLAILSAKAARLAAPVTDAVLESIADLPYDCVRELEGALLRVVAFAELTGSAPSHTDTLRALHPFTATTAAPSPQAIIEAVCQHFSLTRDQLVGASRARDVTYARHIAMYLLRQSGLHSLAEIGTLIGGRDHTTVLNAHRRIQKELAASLPSDTQTHLQQIESSLRSVSAA